ncbi:MAG: hypothetical protein OXB93_06310 [Cytophagales bacterium]|nr:hypothetical protein [Cytophagales bacterium]
MLYNLYYVKSQIQKQDPKQNEYPTHTHEPKQTRVPELEQLEQNENQVPHSKNLKTKKKKKQPRSSPTSD